MTEHKFNFKLDTDRPVCIFDFMKRLSAKEKILDTASELFSVHGYGNIGINEIIRKANTAKASFYQYFPSKEDLCVAWLDKVHEASVKYHESLLKTEEDNKELIITYFESLKTYLKTHSFRSCPFTNTGSFLNSESSKIRSKILMHKEYQENFFIRLVERAACDFHESQIIGKQLFLIFSGASTESQNLQSLAPIDNAILVIQHLFTNKLSNT